jgi:hypothetical protein
MIETLQTGELLYRFRWPQSVVLVSRFSDQLDQSPLPLTKEALGHATEVDMTESGKHVAKEPSPHIG